MECARSVELLSDFHDGTLEQALYIEVRTHLDGCPPCAAVYQDILRIIFVASELRQTPQIKFPDPNAVWQRFDFKTAQPNS